MYVYVYTVIYTYVYIIYVYVYLHIYIYAMDTYAVESCSGEKFFGMGPARQTSSAWPAYGCFHFAIGKQL